MKLIFSYINGLKDGLNIRIIHIMVFLILIPSYILYAQNITLGILNIAAFISLLLTINFFRNPKRNIKYKNNTVYAPADGIVSSIDIKNEKLFLKREYYE